jgi:D-amino-acid dehydrogenase
MRKQLHTDRLVHNYRKTAGSTTLFCASSPQVGDDVPTPKTFDVAVVGAGIVGVSTALALQQASCRVLLIDRNPVGAMTSYGNTGVLVDNPWLGFMSPGLAGRLPGLLMGRSPAVRIDARFALRHGGLFWHLLKQSRSPRIGERIRALHDLLRLSQALHKSWIGEAQADDLLRESGWLKVFRTDRSFRAFAPELDLLARTGTRHRILSGPEIRDLEPALAQAFAHAVLLEGACSVSSPLDLTQRYFALFQRHGGAFETDDVCGLEPSRGGWSLHCRGGRSLAADRTVVALGPWSCDPLKDLGYRVPMFWERGYHRHLQPGPEPALRRPVHDVASGYVMTPQRQGIRVTSGVEIAHRDAPPCYRQIDRAVAAARAAAGLGGSLEPAAWLGSRPTLVDGLPMIGRAPRHPDLWFNFGHHQIGLSLAAGSARLITDMILDRPPIMDPTPFDPRRLL